MDEARKKAKLDETLEKKEVFELEEGVLASVKALPKEELKRKLEQDAKLVALAGKLFEEIPDEVILDPLKTLPIEEQQRHNAEKATMMEIDGEPVTMVVAMLVVAPSVSGVVVVVTMIVAVTLMVVVVVVMSTVMVMSMVVVMMVAVVVILVVMVIATSYGGDN